MQFENLKGQLSTEFSKAYETLFEAFRIDDVEALLCGQVDSLDTGDLILIGFQSRRLTPFLQLVCFLNSRLTFKKSLI